MRGVVVGLAALALVATASATAGSATAGADPVRSGAAAAPPDRTETVGHHRGDNLEHPLGVKQQALRDAARQRVLRGQVQPTSVGGDQVVRVAPGQFVELGHENEDLIFTVVGEFGDKVATHGHGRHGGSKGPLHNKIPEPDRSTDNTTIWTDDFSQTYYEELLFSERDGAVSMRNFYLEQSSGRYTVDGDVTEWVRVPYNAASYGSDYCGSNVCPDTWLFVEDSLDGWYRAQLESGMTAEEIDDYLARYDVWDRYDHDGDGDFDEADGYIDHFQSVHAGVGAETGGGAQGTDAIWSHRWYVQTTGVGKGGPTLEDGTQVRLGGTRIGGSRYWVGDYTIEPENGGVGVFAHEFAHDLGLPDLYDTSGNTGGAENSTAFWTLMSSGSYGSSGEPEDGIGSAPTHMGSWEKFELGWLDHEVVEAGQRSTLRLGPAAEVDGDTQGAFVLLPDKDVPLELGDPYAGRRFYYSDSGDDLDTTMTKRVTVPAGASRLTAKVRYEIEKDWDYAYLTVNGRGVRTNRSTTADPNGQNLGQGITGDSGRPWIDLDANLAAWAGRTVTLGFRYRTDGAVSGLGFQADQVALGGRLIGTAEALQGWRLDGFRTTTGSEVQSFFNAYVLENRQYVGFDDSLRTGPYNFGSLTARPRWVQHFSYQDGLLISYWDASYADNNVGDHPGGGLLLPVDAHPRLEHWADGTLMRPRLLSYDSTFGLEPTESYTVHNEGVPVTIESKPAVPVFEDSRSYWRSCDPHGCTGAHPGRYQPGWSSVDVPDTGTQVEVLSSDGTMKVRVN